MYSTFWSSYMETPCVCRLERDSMQNLANSTSYMETPCVCRVERDSMQNLANSTFSMETPCVCRLERDSMQNLANSTFSMETPCVCRLERDSMQNLANSTSSMETSCVSSWIPSTFPAPRVCRMLCIESLHSRDGLRRRAPDLIRRFRYLVDPASGDMLR